MRAYFEVKVDLPKEEAKQLFDHLESLVLPALRPIGGTVRTDYYESGKEIQVGPPNALPPV